ncbi:MAG: hypothetical protein U5M53_11255 [Rhodoferax sp.]|nr:hypothetical protein [Rhodoferax sp.]
MANIVWNDSPGLCTALLDDVPVCTLKIKDIGGVAASWLDGRLWAPPSHMPKATPQETRFFMGLDEAKQAVEQTLLG